MRIQHNIMAMNAYRNYNNNTSALSKNLEKLSSGYKINRAGDDAAGLAISEKMRSQITGLEAAQKNVKDGISLVKTAEGAMQEIQDMLKRMKYLATQSANGTYDEAVDRDNLQKEVDSLLEEIDRIAESANFNGIKLLDGKMGFTEDVAAPEKMARDSGAMRSGTNSTFTKDTTNVGEGKAVTDVTYEGQGTGDIKISVEKKAAENAKPAVGATGSGANKLAGVSISASASTATKFNDIKIKFVAATGVASTATWNASEKTLTVTLASQGGTNGSYAGSAINTLIQNVGSVGGGIDFSKITVTGSVKASGATAGNPADLGEIGLSGGADEKGAQPAKVVVTAKIGSTTTTKEYATTGEGAWNASGVNEVSFTSGDARGLTVKLDGSKITGDLAETKVGAAEAAKDDSSKIEAGKKIEIDTSSITKNFASGATVKIGNYYFKFEKSRLTGTGTQGDPFVVSLGTNVSDSLKNLADAIKANKTELGVDADFSDGKLTLTTTKDFADADALKAAVNITVTGDPDAGKAFADAWNEAVKKAVSGGSGSIKLHIGDSSQDYDILEVKIKDMHSAAIGIGSLDISTQDKARAAIDKIRQATNYVSSVRGDLGAIQNRLEHTQNNLSVMAENIQDAESTIRDTDVADEMMKYVKNNILVQSAQAMLAQANQVPQGVLQLLG